MVTTEQIRDELTARIRELHRRADAAWEDPYSQDDYDALLREADQVCAELGQLPDEPATWPPFDLSPWDARPLNRTEAAAAGFDPANHRLAASVSGWSITIWETCHGESGTGAYDVTAQGDTAGLRDLWDANA